MDSNKSAGIKALIFVLAFCPISLSAQQSNRFAAVDSFLSAQIQSGKVSGAVALAWERGKEAYIFTGGYADIAGKRPMQRTTIFRLASMTKAIVSVACLRLVEQGKIQLDDPLSRYVPEFAGVQVLSRGLSGKDTLVPLERPITLRHLLTHTSGISSADEYPQHAAYYREAGIGFGLGAGFASLEEEVSALAKIPLMHQPGDRFSYGNSTDVLVRAMEVAGGQPLDQLLKKSIFRPAGMKDTYFYLPASKKSRLATLYTGTPGLTPAIKTSAFDPDYPINPRGTFFSGNGGLVSTPDDYLRFLVTLLTSERLLKADSFQEFISNQIGDKTFIFGGRPSVNPFGLGVGLTSEKGTANNGASTGSFFWGGSFNTSFLADPSKQRITLIFFQHYPFIYSGLLSQYERMVNKVLDGKHHAE